MHCLICNGEPYAGHDGLTHTDVCPGCGECSGAHGGEPTGRHAAARRVDELVDVAKAIARQPYTTPTLRSLESPTHEPPPEGRPDHARTDGGELGAHGAIVTPPEGEDDVSGDDNGAGNA